MSANTTPSASPLSVVRKGSGKPLLMLHRLGGNIASWGNLIDVLAKTNAVIVVDLLGHGASPITPVASTFQGIADAIADVIHAQDIVRLDLIGQSLGRRVAVGMARRGLVGVTVALALVGSGTPGKAGS